MENTTTAGLKVLLINGSPHKEGNTFIALSEVAKSLEAEGVATEIVHIGSKAVQGCIACYKCLELGKCIFNDEPYRLIRGKLSEVDGLIIGSPVYFAGPNGSLCSLLDRLFYSAGDLLQYKLGASVAVCRRSGASATFDRLNNISLYSICQSYHPNIGTVYMDSNPERRSKMQKGFKLCELWVRIWHGY